MEHYNNSVIFCLMILSLDDQFVLQKLRINEKDKRFLNFLISVYKNYEDVEEGQEKIDEVVKRCYKERTLLYRTLASTGAHMMKDPLFQPLFEQNTNDLEFKKFTDGILKVDKVINKGKN